jgi:DNA/RNA-binding domain of Phe-tRNA-synthetase-like protein
MPLVDILLATEMGHGLLAGVQDRDKVDGELVFDLAVAGELMTGMRSSVMCKAAEPVLRDAKDIIASYMQGPDAKTKVLKTTQRAVFFFFSAPGVPGAVFASAIDFAENALKNGSTIIEKVVLKR